MAQQSPFVLSKIYQYILAISVSLLLFKPTNAITNCTSQGHYITNGTFHQNLKVVLSNLTLVANTTKSRFHTSTFGDEKNAVFGLYLCRGDLLQDECYSCVDSIGSFIMEGCPNSKEAIQWEMNCILRYSNRNIFSKEEEEPSADEVLYRNPAPDPNRPPPPPPPPFNVTNVIVNLVNETAFGDYSAPSAVPFFATREDNIPSGWFEQVFYSLAQCTPDISPPLCDKCLKQAMVRMDCCDGITPTHVYLPSCFIEYDTQKFFRAKNQTRRPLLDSRLPPSPSPPPETAQLEEPQKPKGSSNLATIVAIPSAVLGLFLLFSLCFLWRRSNSKRAYQVVDNIITTESVEYGMDTIKAATANFSADNLLGRGRFGSVYKGRLENGQEIAVKKLPSNFGQEDIQEFKNKALVIARLQHRNLVRLLGFCVTSEHQKLLISEFLPNMSLDRYLYDPLKRASLNWGRRYKIIEGIAKGLLYLLEHSQCKIVHENLAPKNILLDKDMTAKISNFGTGMLIPEEQVQGMSSNIVGTYGYMAPEYIISGKLSMKSNVFSFGVIVLEILSGQKSTNSLSTDAGGQEDGLIECAWRLWNAKDPLGFADPALKAGNFSEEEVTRCISIGLSCIQEDPEKRLSIAAVVSLLNSNSSNLPELAPGEGYYKSDSSGTSLGLHQSIHTYTGMEDLTVLSAR